MTLGEVCAKIGSGATPRGGKAMKYNVVIERMPNNYAAYVPNLPGCAATANTRAEVLQEIREAIEFQIEGMRADGEPIPEPQTTAAVVDAVVTATG